VTQVPASTTVAADYSYEMVPATGGATYVGNSAQMSTGSDPYSVVQQAPAPQPTYQAIAPAPQAPAPQPVYEAFTPSAQAEQMSYTQQYDAAPAPAPAQQYDVAVPAPAPMQQAPVNIGGYEFQTVPAADFAQQAPVAAPSYAAQAPAVVPSGTHFVQVGAFLDPNRANKLINQLGSAGVQAFIVPAQVRGKLYHRVRIGAASKRDAEMVLDQVRGLNYYEARIVRG